ncbi:MAG TPA: exodeoxyribonuclease VII large subunit [Acidobacteriota bacterium]|nr:exodeoxyribonuclease VII large subunit [Acidobacteriota bacterium]
MDSIEQRKILTVSEITAEIKQSLDKLGLLWIQGEISNFKHHSSGHMYFSLKDERAQLKAACFRSNNMYLKFRPEDGLEVIVRGRISVYEPRGDYQIIVEYMEPKGLGSLQLAFEQLKERLRKEGLFDEQQKITLPLLPHKIGIVTSPTGAAIRDMLRVLQRRNASLHVLLYPAKVQGAGASEEIAAGVRYFNTRTDVDVIIVGRGGGSIEDLWAFNEEIVARAIHKSRIPVISAVGHEVDFTIADFVADLRAPTPSAAAEMVSGAREDLRATVTSLHGRLVQAMRLGIEARRLRLERLARNRAFSIAPTMIRDFQQRFDESMLRLTQAVRQYGSRLRQSERVLQTRLLKIDLRQTIGRRREIVARNRQHLISLMSARLHKERSRLELAAGRLGALSPLAALQRGYAICKDERGSILKDAASVSPGDRVAVDLARGSIDCRVENVRS